MAKPSMISAQKQEIEKDNIRKLNEFYVFTRTLIILEFH